MKTLPDNPNLDHLRRQAKDLLVGLRDSDPTASLADAQASLAEQYGFRTWTDLKSEVDRRRGQVDIADPVLAGAIASRYGLGEVVGAMRSVARADDMGRRWSLQTRTRRGRWAVRTMDTWIPIVDADTDVGLQEAAAAAGVTLPLPVRSRSGAIVESIGGHAWRVNEWLHSGPPLSAPVGSSTTHAVGVVLAKIHRLQIPVDRISPWHAARLSQMTWAELAATATTRHAGWASELSEAVPTLVDLEAIGADEPAAPPVLCHNNLTPGNVRLGKDGGPVIVGWEHAGGQPPSWELTEALAHWAIDPGGGLNVAGASAMVDGYRSEAGSLPALDMAAFRGTVVGLANYVYEQVEGAMNAQSEEDQRYAGRSARHLPSRANLEQLLDLALAAERPKTSSR